MNLQRYLTGKFRKATTRAAAHALLDLLDDLEKDSHTRTHELNLFNSGVKVNIDVAERKLYGAIRKAVERKMNIKAEQQPEEPPRKERETGLDPNKAI
jgi:hypothetical protein